MATIWDKIIKFSLYLLVFLVPLFWLPFSFEAFEFNKQYLIFFLVSISFLAWLARMILVEKEISFKRTPLDLPVLIFLMVAILSAIFSVDKSSSLFGFYGRFSNGLIVLLSLGVLYFLITNNRGIGEKGVAIQGLVKIFLLAVFFVVLISYLSIFGIWQKIPEIPPIMSQRTFNPVSGSLEGLAVFLAIFLALLVGRCLIWQIEEGKLSLIINYLLLIALLGLLIIVDFNRAWIVLAISFGLFLIFALATRIFRENVNRLLLPIFLIFISIIFLFFDSNQLTKFSLPKEPVLDQVTSWKTAFGAIKESIKSGFLGSGIGTFHYDFTKFKPLEFNQSLWWEIRYDRSGSHISEILGTLGILGILSYFLLVGSFFLISWFLIRKRETLPFLLTFLAIILSQFFYYQNTVLAFTFWFFLGLAVLSWQKPISEKKISFKDFPELSLIFSTLLILLSLLLLGIYFFGVRFHLADVNYFKAQITPLGERKIKFLENSINLNPKLANYRIILARNYLLQILEEIGKPQAEQDLTKIQNLVEMAIRQAKISTQLAPKSVASWETLGMIYREIQLLAAGATEWAMKLFEEAIKLEPKNPVLWTELGKLHLISDISKAREYFAKAKELKSNYLDALIQEALIFEREQNLEEAIKRIEELVVNYPFDIETRFQLGRLYFNKDRLDDAIAQFENVISLFPNHSNSLYSLGLAYTRKGEKEKAISAFERVLELNPGNQDVIQKLENLRKQKIESLEMDIP